MMKKRYVNFTILGVVVGHGPIGDIIEMHYLFKKPSSQILFKRVS